MTDFSTQKSSQALYRLRRRGKAEHFRGADFQIRAPTQPRTQRSGSRLEAKKKPIRRMRKALRLFSSP